MSSSPNTPDDETEVVTPFCTATNLARRTDMRYIEGVRDTVAMLADYVRSLPEQVLSSDRVEDMQVTDATRGHEQHPAALIHKLLAGLSVDAAELETLDYGFDAWHVGMIAVGAEGDRVVRDLAARLDRQLLRLPQLDGTVWAWLGGQRRLTSDDIGRCLSDRLSAGPALVIGDPARGLDGWRLTHAEAHAALTVARCEPRSLIRCTDVLLEAAVLADPTLLQVLKSTYLNPLDDLRDGGRAIRATLRAYFDADCSIAKTARCMGIAPATVRYRLHKAAERLGCTVTERHAELAVALRLEALCEPHSLR
jgi:hypothetical protein